MGESPGRERYHGAEKMASLLVFRRWKDLGKFGVPGENDSYDRRAVEFCAEKGLVKKDMLRYMQDVRALRGMGRGLSEH